MAQNLTYVNSNSEQLPPKLSSKKKSKRIPPSSIGKIVSMGITFRYLLCYRD